MFRNLKRIFLLCVCLFCLESIVISNLVAQNKEINDYFAIGVFGGTYVGQFPLNGKNNILNSVAIEGEYFKFSDLSFYVQGLYQFTISDVRKLFKIPREFPVTVIQKPETYRLNISFGGKYYLRSKSVNPFFQFGINQEVNYIGKFDYQTDLFQYIRYSYSEGYYFYRLSLNLGVGISLKLTNKVKLELKYDLYKSIIKSGIDYNGYSVLGGIKYDL